MSRLTEAQKTALVLAHPSGRAEPCGTRFYIADLGYKPGKVKATFTTLFPRRVVRHNATLAALFLAYADELEAQPLALPSSVAFNSERAAQLGGARPHLLGCRCDDSRMLAECAKPDHQTTNNGVYSLAWECTNCGGRGQFNWD